MDFNQLVDLKTVDGSIMNWVSNSRIPATTVLTDAQDWIYESLRVPEMLTVNGAIALAQAADSTPVTADYCATKVLAYTGIDFAEIRNNDAKGVELAFQYDSTGARVQGKPKFFYRIGLKLQFDVPAQQAYTLRHLFYARQTYLSTVAPTNFLTDRCKRLLRCACVAFASEWLKDDSEKTYWLGLAQNEIDRLNTEADLESLDANLVVTTQ